MACKALRICRRQWRAGQDVSDDISLATRGFPHQQVVDMVNWWLKNTASTTNTQVKQIKLTETRNDGITEYWFDPAEVTTGTGVLQGVTGIESVNGHSLGGYLATAFVRIFGGQWPVGHTTTFNSAGFSKIAALLTDIESGFTQIASAIGANNGLTAFNSQTQQDNVYAENGPNVTTNDWLAGFTQYGKRTALFQEDLLSGLPEEYVSSNHFMYKQTDLLALGAALEKLDPNLTFDTLNTLIKTGSNDMAASYEGVLDALRKALLGTAYNGNTPTGDVGDNAASRAVFHQTLQNLTDSSDFQALKAPTQSFIPGQAALESKVTIRAVAGDTALVNKAKTNFSDFIKHTERGMFVAI
jgi:trimeric autotransporter adhesin